MPARVVVVLVAFLALAGWDLEARPGAAAPFETQHVRDLQVASSLKASPDGSMLALMDGSHGPTDQYGTHFLQLVVFDTSTGEQLYRTPDGDPDPDEDVTDLYEESMPIWEWVTDEQIAIEGVTVDITTGDVTVQDPERVGAYLFADR